MKNKKIIVALDSSNFSETLELIKNIKEESFAFKVGYEFFFNFGIDGLDKIINQKIKIFLDLKLHDIPNTVKNGIAAISKLNPHFTTIHISGGDKKHKAANSSKGQTKILGVSVLTSLSSEQTQKFYFNKDINEIISRFAKSALTNGLDGIVCSPNEIKTIKKITLNKLLIITPGIRPINYIDSKDDQHRTMTPREAINNGADYLVIGRPITKSTNPLKEIQNINSSLE